MTAAFCTSEFFEPDHEQFRAAAREFVRREVVDRLAAWEVEQRIADPSVCCRSGSGQIRPAIIRRARRHT